MTSRRAFDIFRRVTTLAEGIAEALRWTRPDSSGAAFRQWGDDVVAVAACPRRLDSAFDYSAFFTAGDGL